MIASQYFLLQRQSKITLIYDCHMDGEMFNPIGIFDIDKKNCQNMKVFHNTFLNFLITLVNERHLSDLKLIVPCI